MRRTVRDRSDGDEADVGTTPLAKHLAPSRPERDRTSANVARRATTDCRVSLLARDRDATAVVKFGRVFPLVTNEDSTRRYSGGYIRH